MHPFLEHHGPIPFAHRGGASEAPENTLAAFSHAITLGYRYLETDVHASRDGVLMAFHDDDLSRTCGIEAKISQLDYEQIRQYRVENREPIPTLRDILEAFPEARINIDCKSDNAVQPLIEVLKDPTVRARVCIGAFSDRRLRILRSEFDRSLCTSMGPREVAAFRLLPARASAPQPLSAQAAQVPMATGPISIVNQRFVERCHENGLHVHVWTIDDRATMQSLLDLGVDGIMTDQPSTLKEVLIHRREWNGSS